MIEIGPSEGSNDAAVIPAALPLSLVITHAAGELDRLAGMIILLEDAMLAAQSPQKPPPCGETLQSIDVLHQSVIALSGFLSGLVDQTGAVTVDVREPASRVTLGKMRARLCGGDAPAPDR